VPEGVAAQVLMNQGLKLADVRQEVARLLGQPAPTDGSDPTAGGSALPRASGQPYTAEAQRVMQLANQEAQRFNHEYIGTEHILLGLIRAGFGIAARILGNLDAAALGQASASVEPSDPLSPFRKQVESLLERLRKTAAAEAAERLQELSRLAKQLAVLLEEVRSRSIAERETQSLQGLLQDLRRLLAKPQLTAAEITEMCERAERVLEEFASPGAAAAAGRRDEFWK
jgi:ATP-dependent Clp protease ATP-binding subunit ClpC